MTDMDNNLSLSEELEFFHAIKPALLMAHKRRFALIKGQILLGAYPTFEEANRVAVEKIGRLPFLIKQVTEQDAVHRMPNPSAT